MNKDTVVENPYAGLTPAEISEQMKLLEEASKQSRMAGVAKIHEIAGSIDMLVRLSALPNPGRYKSADGKHSWSGRGMKPRWLKDAIAAGATLESFAVS